MLQKRENPELDERLKKNISKVLELINEFPNWKYNETDLETKLSTIFNKTKLILIKLKIPVKIIDRSVDSEF